MPPAAGGFPQTPLTEEFETQEVREQLYICEVLHVGLKPQHAAPHKWCQDKSKDWGMSVCSCVVYVFTYSTSPRNGNRANGNHLEICLLSSRKNRNSLTWVLVALTVCFTYPVLYRFSAESRAGEWEL